MARGESSEEQRRRARAKDAWAKRDRWQYVLMDAYDYVAPHRLSTRQYQKAPGSRVDRIFDSHPVNTLHRACGRLQQDIFPSGEPHFTLEPGPAIPEDQRDQRRAELGGLCAKIHPVYLNGDFDAAVAEMLWDRFISTGYVLIQPGDDDRPVRWINVPQDEMALDSGPWGDPTGFFWKRKWKRRQVKEAWPDGKFSDAFLQELKSKGEEDVVLCQDTIWEPDEKAWRASVHVEGDNGAPIHESDSRACPWMCFRYFRLPGEDYGFGPVLMTLPLIRTLNKVQELALKGQALAMLGIYTRIDDGVFNPDTARVEPGAFWQVARNGGPLGPSIQRLAAGTDPNLAMIPVQDLRLLISAGMMDEQLPPDGQSPRAAAEIIERTRRLAVNHAGAFGRIVHDLVAAPVPRVLEILQAKRIVKDAPKIDQLSVKLKVLSPLARAMKSRQAQTTVEWLQVAAALAGPQRLDMVTPLDRTLAELGHEMGVPPERINTVAQQQAMAQAIQRAVQAALAAQAKQQTPPPPNGDPAQGVE